MAKYEVVAFLCLHDRSVLRLLRGTRQQQDDSRSEDRIIDAKPSAIRYTHFAKALGAGDGLPVSEIPFGCPPNPGENDGLCLCILDAVVPILERRLSKLGLDLAETNRRAKA